MHATQSYTSRVVERGHAPWWWFCDVDVGRCCVHMVCNTLWTLTYQPPQPPQPPHQQRTMSPFPTPSSSRGAPASHGKPPTSREPRGPLPPFPTTPTLTTMMLRGGWAAAKGWHVYAGGWAVYIIHDKGTLCEIGWVFVQRGTVQQYTQYTPTTYTPYTPHNPIQKPPTHKTHHDVCTRRW